jgi:hypothetical protein
MSLHRWLAGALIGAALAVSLPANANDCRAPLSRAYQIELYFGRSLPGGGSVSDWQFRKFLAEIVTPRFPDGLTVIDAEGQFRPQGGSLVRERTKLLILLVPKASAVDSKVEAVIAAYKRRFGARVVPRTETPICWQLG